MNFQARPDFPIGTMNILGVDTMNISRQEAISFICQAVAERRFTRVAFLNAHSANIAFRDQEFTGILGSYFVLPDGIGVDIGAKLLYGTPFRENLNGTDFVPALLSQAGSPLVVGIVGALREHGERATAGLADSNPMHRFVYLNDGFLEPEDEPDVLARIEELRPDILLVGMGVPLQEKWIFRNIDARHCTVPVAVGALLDFLSGAVPRAPVIVRRYRLEWLYRLAMEPGRLWKRYILGNPLFLLRIARQKTKHWKSGARTGEPE